MYIHHEGDAALSWDKNDPDAYGAGYYDEAFSASFSELVWSADAPVIVGEDGNPDPQGHYLLETIHVSMSIDDHPDWEWIKLQAGWDGNYEMLSATFDTQWVPEPASALLLLLGLAPLMRRRMRR